MAKELTAERLRELLDYDPEKGTFTWRVGRRGTARPGTTAGNQLSLGYIQLRIDGRPYLAHRLAWLYVHGVWPTADIDHVNGVTGDNRLGNLREATRGENKRNSGCRRDSRIGFKGVERMGRTFRAVIRVDGRRVRLHGFDTPEKAHEAYCKLSAELHGKFGRAK